MGDEYTIADIAIFPWVRVLETHYHAADELELDTREHTMEWMDRCVERPASKIGLNTPKRD